MKKSLLFLAALALGASAAMAQVENPVLPTTATFSSAEGVEDDMEDINVLPSVDATITVTFNSAPNVPIHVMYATGGGFEIGIDSEYFSAGSNTISIPLNKDKWGIPYNEMYLLHLVVTFTYDVEVDEEIVTEYYPDAQGEPVMFECTYMTPDTGDAFMAKYAPNNGMFNDYYTFDNAYEDGNMFVYFSKVVTAPTEVATVTLYNTEGKYLDSYETILTSQEWSDMDGLYQIVFPYSTPDYTAAQISTIEIELSPVEWYNPATKETESITSPVIVLNNKNAAPKAAPRKAKKGVANGLAVGTESVNVYNLQGMLVLKNASTSDINNLAPGMYIVNGKKVAVK